MVTSTPTLEISPGGGTADLRNVTTYEFIKDSGILQIAELLGDSDSVEALKQIASRKLVRIDGIKVGTAAALETFAGYINDWGVNGDGTTGTSVSPTPIQFVPPIGDPFNGLVIKATYTYQAGQVSILRYQIIFGEFAS